MVAHQGMEVASTTTEWLNGLNINSAKLSCPIDEGNAPSLNDYAEDGLLI